MGSLCESKETSMDWIIHLDINELLHPIGATKYSLQCLLQDVAFDVDMVGFPNYVKWLHGMLEDVIKREPPPCIYNYVFWL